jgi:hypothetical protein
MSKTVRVLSTSSEVPVMVNGTVSNDTESALVVHCSSEASALSSGCKVVLTFNDGTDKISGTVTNVQPMGEHNFNVEISKETVHQRDMRDFPRLWAGLPIRYQNAAQSGTDTEAVRSAWNAGAATDGVWYTPDPYMNFSVGGLRFNAPPSVKESDVLLIELCLVEGGTTWRTTGKVMRVFDDLHETDQGPQNSVAVAFIDLPSDALDELSNLTLQIQDTLL